VDDAEDDYQWRVDPELAELDATTPLRMDFEDFKRHLRDELRYPTPWVRRYAIDTLDGRHIGNCMAYDIDTVTGESEVGIMVGDRQYWSKGYGREAMALLVDEMFRMNSMRRVYLHTLEWNARARRAFAGCGFRELRQERRSGLSFILMEMTRAEWMVHRKKLLGDQVQASAE
jgi:RimJ/RimL family protein N-acetyltransferase